MKDNKITVRFTNDELTKIKDIANKKGIKVATLIRRTALNSITNDELLCDKEEIKRFIIETVEETNDKKLGRIISLLFRATSRIDIVKEQNNMFYRLIHSNYNWPREYEWYEKRHELEHQITRYAVDMVETRDKENIERHNRRNKK